MSVALLKKYINMIISEADVQARVPTQLLSPEETDGEDNGNRSEEEDDGVDEHCAVGAIAGYTAPMNLKNSKVKKRK